MSPAPDVGEVPRKFAGHNENGVDPNVVARASVARCEALGGNCDPAKAKFVESKGRGVVAPSLLDLHEGDGRSAPGDQVHFAPRNAGPTREDSPSM